MAAALCAAPGLLVASATPQRSQQHAAAPAATLRQQPWAAPTLRLAQQQLRRPCLAAGGRRRRPAAPAAIATTGGSEGEAAPPAAGAGGLQQLLRAAYGWLCSLKPPKSLWRSIAALVLGGEALVRILQGARRGRRPVDYHSLHLPQAARSLHGGRCTTAPPACPLFFPLVSPPAGKVHWKNTIEQLDMVGPRSLGVCLLTAAFVGMVFTIQFIR